MKNLTEWEQMKAEKLAQNPNNKFYKSQTYEQYVEWCKQMKIKNLVKNTIQLYPNRAKCEIWGDDIICTIKNGGALIDKQ